MTSRVTLGEQFVRAVRVRGLTFTQLANLAGVSITTVSTAMRHRPVNMTTALRLCRAVEAAPVIPELEAWAEAS